jgi:hypothetical protein
VARLKVERLFCLICSSAEKLIVQRWIGRSAGDAIASGYAAKLASIGYDQQKQAKETKVGF